MCWSPVTPQSSGPETGVPRGLWWTRKNVSSAECAGYSVPTWPIPRMMKDITRQTWNIVRVVASVPTSAPKTPYQW